MDVKSDIDPDITVNTVKCQERRSISCLMFQYSGRLDTGRVTLHSRIPPSYVGSFGMHPVNSVFSLHFTGFNCYDVWCKFN